jgi:hypothetical protein
MPNEPRPADYENWLECPKCFWVCPIFAAEKEAETKDAIETLDNPFETKTIIETFTKRVNKTGK